MKLDPVLARLLSIANISCANLRAIMTQTPVGFHEGTTSREVLSDNFIGKALRRAEPRLLAMTVMLTDEDEMSITAINVDGIAGNDDGEYPSYDTNVTDVEGSHATYTITASSNGASLVEMVAYDHGDSRRPENPQCFFSTIAMGNCIRREVREAVRNYDAGPKAPAVTIMLNTQGPAILALLQDGRFSEAFDAISLDEVYRDTMERSIKTNMPELNDRGGLTLNNECGMTPAEIYGDSLSVAYRGRALQDVLHIPSFMEGLTVSSISYENEDYVYLTIDFDLLEAETLKDAAKAA